MSNNTNIFKKRLTKKDIFTIPNLMTYFRIILVPFIVYAYFNSQFQFTVLILIILSSLSDIFDGIIARKYNMVSDLGKFLDPFADKLTQGMIIICLTITYPQFLKAIILFILKELIMLIYGYIMLKKTDVMNMAKWYGKAATVVIETILMVLVSFRNIPINIVNILIWVIMGAIIFSFIGYSLDCLKIYLNYKKQAH